VRSMGGIKKGERPTSDAEESKNIPVTSCGVWFIETILVTEIVQAYREDGSHIPSLN
jgi:hypothetical protein